MRSHKRRIDKIIVKQYDIADKFIELIDEVLRAESENLENETDEPQQPGNSADSAGHTVDATQPTPDMPSQASQLETQMGATQFEEIHERQQHIRTVLETFPDESDVVSDQQRGAMATEEMEHNDSGPVFDQTPTPHDDTLKGTTNSGSDPPLTEQECIRSLWDLICSKDIDQSRVVIDYGDYSANCMDIYESFAEGKCLEDVFMQCFIECVRDDSKNHRRTLTSNRLILDVNVGALLNFEEQERHSKNPQPFDQNVLQNCLHNTLPALVNLDKCKSIMVPMLSRGHWTLYVINLHHRVIHILDSNPYGIQLGGTEWKDYHYDPIYLGGRKFPWARVIMSRLSKALQHVCPNAEFPKFGNFPLDMPSNCPTMRTGSNDCGFFVMSYMKSYDHNAGVISSFNQPDNSRDLRAHALHQLTFHRINKALPLPLDIQRFMFARN